MLGRARLKASYMGRVNSLRRWFGEFQSQTTVAKMAARRMSAIDMG
jgi:hypothetical protein